MDYLYEPTGHYMYIEASGVSNQVAQLSSLQETQTGAACIQFWFHMYGNNIGTLNVYTAQGGQNGSPVWSRQRNQGNRWNLAQISINPSSPYSVILINSILLLLSLKFYGVSNLWKRN